MTIAAARKKQKEAQAEELKKHNRELRNIFAVVCGQAEGILVFRHIMRQCGYQKPSVVANPNSGEINTNSTVYNEARRNLYLSLRKLIPQKYLKQIEFSRSIKE